MTHCFNVISTCRPDGHCLAAGSHRVTIKPSAAQHFLKVSRIGVAGLLRCREWHDDPQLWQRNAKINELHIGTKLQTQIYTDKWRLNRWDVQGLGRDWDRMWDKEGSGFPCASALFLGDWNVLQEQFKLPHSVMALPPGTVQTRLICSSYDQGCWFYSQPHKYPPLPKSLKWFPLRFSFLSAFFFHSLSSLSFNILCWL